MTPDDSKGKAKLFYLCCLYGSAKDVVALFEELRGTPLGQAAYEDVIARCLYLGDREKPWELRKNWPPPGCGPQPRRPKYGP